NKAQLARGEWWRLLTSQFVHVNPAHMLFNVIALFLLAAAVERAQGALVVMIVWLLSGIAGMYASIYSVSPPYDVGSGASQALMGVAAASIFVVRADKTLWLRLTLILTLALQLALDLMAAHHPKPGHIVGFLVGLLLAILVVHNRPEATLK